ncbi:MAG: hypothetical protein PVF27_05640 [Gemmatimonadales bacterium]|jgi:hypothetical protein
MRTSNVLAAVGAVLVAGLFAGPLAAQDRPAAMSHTVEGRADCLMCHGGNMENIAVPVSHADRPNETCLWCHAPDAAMVTVDPTAIPHALEGRANCMMCHSGAMEAVPGVPEDHEGRANEYCALCHTPG